MPVHATQHRMTKEEFAAELARLGMSAQQAAIVLGVNDRTIRRWLAGDRSLPPAVVRLLATMTPEDHRPPVTEPVSRSQELQDRQMEAARLADAEIARREALAAAEATTLPDEPEKPATRRRRRKGSATETEG